jgi:hypothetical protein
VLRLDAAFFALARHYADQRKKAVSRPPHSEVPISGRDGISPLAAERRIGIPAAAFAYSKHVVYSFRALA